MVTQQPRRIIAPEIAALYGRELTTVTGTWRRHPDWPAPTGRRGRWAEYDAAAVDAVVKEHFLRQPLQSSGDPEDLLTIADIVTYTGLARGTVDGDISRGRIPPADDTEHGVKRWRRSTIDTAMQGRRGYHRRAQQGSEPA